MSTRSFRRPANPVRLLAGRLLGVAALACLPGCRRDMYDQPRMKPFGRNEFFADERAMRPTVPGTVARGRLELDELLYKGTEGGKPAERFPFPVTLDVLERGRDRFGIYCAICHGLDGSGKGMVVGHGYIQPASLHAERLRTAPLGHFFSVITEGFGAMADYSDRIEPRDRWAIVAYVRALQESQYAPVDELPENVRQQLSSIR
jgi:mono/diheme cytochrome c family protein